MTTSDETLKAISEVIGNPIGGVAIFTLNLAVALVKRGVIDGNDLLQNMKLTAQNLRGDAQMITVYTNLVDGLENSLKQIRHN